MTEPTPGYYAVGQHRLQRAVGQCLFYKVAECGHTGFEPVHWVLAEGERYLEHYVQEKEE